jgi:hypothetical protein
MVVAPASRRSCELPLLRVVNKAKISFEKTDILPVT